MMRSTMYLGALLVLFVATAGAQYDRKMGAASAPAPAGGMWHHHPWALAPGPAGMKKMCEDHNPQTDADLLFTLTANQATFTNANTLQLSGISSAVSYTSSYRHGATPGVVMTSMFTNSTPGSQYVSSNGQWLASPDAALLGTTNSTNMTTAVLLALSNPMFDSATQMVSFTVSVVPANESDIKLHKGVVNGLVWEAEKGNASPLVSAVQPGATLTNVALFIDSNKESLHPAAATEDWHGGWGGGWNGGGGGWNGGGWNGGGWNGGGGWGGGWGSGISINVGR